MDEKAIKKQVLVEASKHPEKFFPLKTLKSKGFARHQCDKCKRYFWSTKPSKVCGDPACSGGFRFIGNSPAKKKLDYIGTWKEFARIHQKLGYTPIKRYPVVARWNPTVDFTIADIAAFQPYVVSGEIAPPANPLVIPQFCLRFGDIDNVGITGHHVGFVMMGEKEFVTLDKYNVERYMNDHLTWLTEGIGLPLDELTIHEDVWAGGGNLGPCMEFFSRGLEISNQVYMQYEITSSGLKELKLKVLDMGEGMERVPWFTSGNASIYETTFPPVIKKMREITGVVYDEKFMQKFTPLAPYLNTGEVDDLEGAWKFVAGKLGRDVQALKDKVLPLAALYSVAEHTRALLVAINDGGLPSNVGGMYNLRVILRRALGFIDKYGWKLSLPEIARWHADYLEPLFPELQENLDNIAEILEVEKKKYEATRKKTAAMLPKLLEKKLTTDELVTLYDSQGISPELLVEEALKQGKKLHIPENFYSLVAERHLEKEQEHATERAEKIVIDSKISPTKALYFDDCTKVTFDASVLQVTDKFVILDRTLFYPVSGGQIADVGTLGDSKIVNVFKQGAHIVHVCAETPKFKVGQKVHGEIDFERRLQLAQHHTATHIINAAARDVLGSHINQAGAKKDIDKAHIDITHYDSISDEELAQIEKEANAIVKKGVATSLTFMPRDEAEKKYGMAIYQGGAVPGKFLRIVNIPGIDVEACGGTHLKNTSETGHIKIIKASKIKDGIVRLVFVAGKAAKQIEQKEKDILDRAAALLKCKVSQVPERAQELFELWKKAKKAKQKGTSLTNTTLKSTAEFKGDILAKTAEILQTQPEVIVKTIERFLADIEMFKK
ncbi:alanine--tRNA ligase [Candidatus Woesearchaeota archaeon]|nr:alanine--tRNA ligase [Candidatus Woesearchaeota archaeon]